VVRVTASLPPVAVSSLPRLDGRLAAGPISWGVCEVPGWGVELPPERVLAEMRALGIEATEFGPIGYLGSNAAAVTDLLSRYGLTLVGGFVPVVLHDALAVADSLESARETAELYAACGARFLVSAVVVDEEWAERVPLDEAGWSRIADGLDRLDELARAAGLDHVLHPHVGTLVETREDLEHVLELSGVGFCLDTGHLVLGGVDPVAFARSEHERVRHVHLKDVAEDVVRRWREGKLTLVEAVRAGLFRPLGTGDAPIAETVAILESGGYSGWYVLEQDAALEGADSPPGGGPADDVRRSIEYLRAVMGAARTTTPKEGTE
jgi:inosose dehydratase